MTVPQEVVDLIEKFKKHEKEYKSTDYSEEDTKDEFITPLFEALGWDVHNKQGLSPSKKEVRFERQQKITGGKFQYPDYTFYIDGNQRFLVEAKKPSKNLETDSTIINQVRGYGYRAGFFLSIITNFDELVIYDTKFKPHLNDDYQFYRLKYYKCTDYVEKWDEISSILSKTTIENNEHIDILPDYPNISLIYSRGNDLKNEPETTEDSLEEEVTNDNHVDPDVEVDIVQQESFIKDKIKQRGTLFKDIPWLYNKGGIETGRNKCFTIDDKKREELLHEDPNSSDIIEPLLVFNNLSNQKTNDEYLIITEKELDVQKEYPAVYEYLCQFKTELESRSVSRIGKHWYNIGCNINFNSTMNKPKIIFPEKYKKFIGFFDSEGKYCLFSSAYFIYHETNDLFYLKILSSILSSNLINFYLKSAATRYENDSRYYFYSSIKELPIIDINKDDPGIIKLSTVIDALQKVNEDIKKLERDLKDVVGIQKSKDIQNQIKTLKRDIQKLDNQKNKMIYELYDITPEEVNIIEGESLNDIPESSQATDYIVNDVEDEENITEVINKNSATGVDNINDVVKSELTNITDKVKEKGVLLRNSQLVNHGGIVLPQKNVFIINNEMRENFIREDPKNSKIIKPLLLSEDIVNQSFESGKYLINTKRDLDIESGYPVVYKYLKRFQVELEKRTNTGVHFYNVKSYPESINKPKIVYPGLKNSFVSLIDYDGIYHLTGSEYFIYHKNDDLSVLRILNAILSSELMNFYIKLAKSEYDVKKFSVYKVINDIPIVEINKDNPKIKQLVDVTENLYNEKKILEQFKKLYEDMKSSDEHEYLKNHKSYIETKIKELEDKINEIIYDLYDITPEERKIIEIEIKT